MNIAIFVSGNGTNCENLIRHFQTSDVARVELVISNRADAFALQRAQRRRDHHAAAVDQDGYHQSQVKDGIYPNFLKAR